MKTICPLHFEPCTENRSEELDHCKPVNMTNKPPDDVSAQPVNVIEMNFSDFTQYVTSNKSSTNFHEQLLSVVQFCEHAVAAVPKDITENMKSRLQHRKSRTDAWSLFQSSQGKEVSETNDSQVSSTHNSKESSQEFDIANELALAKASGIHTNFREVINSQSQPEVSTSGQDSWHDCVNNDNNDGGSALRIPMAIQNISQDQGVDSQNDFSHEKETFESEHYEYKYVIEEEVKVDTDIIMAEVKSISSGVGSVQQMEVVGPIAPDSEILTSQPFFSTVDHFQAAKDLPVKGAPSSQQSIEALVGSVAEDQATSSAGSEYSMPWEVSNPRLSPVANFDPESVLATEEMALVTEDYVPQTENEAPSSESDGEAVVSVPVSEVYHISWDEANAVLMRRSRIGNIEASSADEELSSEAI